MVASPRKNTSKRTIKPVETICSELWFSDGNIILKTEDTLFKVHRGQLTRHSEIFDSLFSIPQPMDQNIIDGCPVIEMHDKPQDMYAFLKALYDGLYFNEPPTDDFSTVASVLRLSSKYFVEHLRIRCLERLENDWPCSIGAWDRRELAATDDNGHYAPREYYPHPILLVDLAVELDLSQFLPAALYDLCRYGPSKTASSVAPPLPPMHEN